MVHFIRDSVKKKNHQTLKNSLEKFGIVFVFSRESAKINIKVMKMKFSRKWMNFGVIWTITICLLLSSSVHSYPKGKSSKSVDQSIENSAIATETVSPTVETLNSKNSNDTKNNEDKPVFGIRVPTSYRTERSIESEKISTNQTKSSEHSSRQFTIPFMAVPANWIATFEPANAAIITSHVPLRVWAIGAVAKFPTFLERIVQRIQSYYSTYKYQDLSRPSSHAIISPQYHQHDFEFNGPSESTDNMGSVESIHIHNDPIEDSSTEFDTETSFSEDYDTTTDMNYIDLNDYGTTESSTEIL